MLTIKNFSIPTGGGWNERGETGRIRLGGTRFSPSFMDVNTKVHVLIRVGDRFLAGPSGCVFRHTYGEEMGVGSAAAFVFEGIGLTWRENQSVHVGYFSPGIYPDGKELPREHLVLALVDAITLSGPRKRFSLVAPHACLEFDQPILNILTQIEKGDQVGWGDWGIPLVIWRNGRQVVHRRQDTVAAL